MSVVYSLFRVFDFCRTRYWRRNELRLILRMWKLIFFFSVQNTRRLLCRHGAQKKRQRQGAQDRCQRRRRGKREGKKRRFGGESELRKIFKFFRNLLVRSRSATRSISLETFGHVDAARFTPQFKDIEYGRSVQTLGGRRAPNRIGIRWNGAYFTYPN